MNTNKLKIQKEYTYKELCEILGDEEKARGNSRNSQLNNWERYFKFYKPNPKGQKFIVSEIYNEPKEKMDGRKDGNNDKYQNYMSIVIEDYLASCNKFKIDTTIGRLALYSNMVSKEYIDCKNDGEDDYFDKLKNISNRTSLDNVIFNMYHVLRDGIHGALNKLQKQGKISYKDVIYIEIDGKVSVISEEMQKEYKKIENMITNEIMYKYNKKSKSGIINSSKIRKIYYNRITEEFRKKYNNVNKIFNGVEIIILNCNASVDIIEINNKLIQIIKDNILEKNKNQVLKVKAEYEDKENSGGYGDCKPPMANYEIDIIKNEKSYIEDTIRLMELFCGKIKQAVNKNIENIEKAKIIDIKNPIKKDDIEETNITVPKRKSSRYNLIDIESIGNEQPIHKDKDKNKERTFESVIASIKFLAKARERKNIYINEAESKDENDYEITTLNMVINEYRNDIQKVQNKINRIEEGVKEGDLKDLYKRLNHLYECYNEYYQMMIDSCKNDTPMAI